MGILKEFKAFALKGNVIDLAVAVIIGAAFGAIVSSLVDDVITPLILNPALKAANVDDLSKLTWGAVKYGNFLAAVLKFTVIAFVIFMLLKAANSVTKKKEEAPPAPAEPSSTDKLLMEIRDALKK
ncbi:MAG TPA: large conductance mechanosensitive channel protein MscL [Ferruginibacter sp.]|nr:large conductance mechanosensitive channel protein MscL [Ferruginibacter sp.]HRO05129.1 large conductance mechanosensitive channel protein MscL [Ferruginibacter sp.]HRO95566.1 large conductance mechanosensitive channel protein MscL [Ferruginibacter sp.]HRP49575.1 large conductance mechanosensitive channel protein MscL [Ferruginibacter sp.]